MTGDLAGLRRGQWGTKTIRGTGRPCPGAWANLDVDDSEWRAVRLRRLVRSMIVTPGVESLRFVSERVLRKVSGVRQSTEGWSWSW